MAVFGYFIYVLFCLVVSFYCAIGLRFGGFELSPAGGKMALLILIILFAVWYFAYQWFPFNISMK